MSYCTKTDLVNAYVTMKFIFMPFVHWDCTSENYQNVHRIKIYTYISEKRRKSKSIFALSSIRFVCSPYSLPSLSLNIFRLLACASWQNCNSSATLVSTTHFIGLGLITPIKSSKNHFVRIVACAHCQMECYRSAWKTIIFHCLNESRASSWIMRLAWTCIWVPEHYAVIVLQWYGLVWYGKKRIEKQHEAHGISIQNINHSGIS